MAEELSDSLKDLTTGDVAIENPSVTVNNTPAQIDADMMQIDSILKALNSGTFDQSNMMTIDHLTAQKPKNVLSAVQLAPSTGLSLIGQLSSDEDDDSSSSDSEDSDCESVNEDNNDINGGHDSEDEVTKKKSEAKKHGYPMVKGEVDYRDLPIEEVITEECPSSVELTDVGSVKSVTEKLIIIESSNSAAPLDEGTMFWNSQRQLIGKLFETFGPVKNPFYSIRINENIVQNGERLFVALGNSDFTKFAFMQHITRLKGCDASWKNDEEVPEEFQEFSDDESEKKAKKDKLPSTRKTKNSRVASRDFSRGVSQNDRYNRYNQGNNTPATNSLSYQRPTPPITNHNSQLMTPPCYPPQATPPMYPTPYYPQSNVPPIYPPMYPAPPSTHPMYPAPRSTHSSMYPPAAVPPPNFFPTLRCPPQFHVSSPMQSSLQPSNPSQSCSNKMVNDFVFPNNYNCKYY